MSKRQLTDSVTRKPELSLLTNIFQPIFWEEPLCSPYMALFETSNLSPPLLHLSSEGSGSLYQLFSTFNTKLGNQISEGVAEQRATSAAASANIPGVNAPPRPVSSYQSGVTEWIDGRCTQPAHRRQKKPAGVHHCLTAPLPASPARKDPRREISSQDFC